jgi:anti-sigma regulatory factor (Ser/Thr protein kinase)
MQRTVKRELHSLEEIFLFLGEFTGLHGIGPEASYGVTLAVEELFTNMVKYNRQGDPEILLTLACDGRSLVATLTDCGGAPFDVTRAAEVDTTRPLEERPVGGLGLHLVRQMVDAIDYYQNGRCGTVTIVKNLEQPHVLNHR